MREGRIEERKSERGLKRVFWRERKWRLPKIGGIERERGRCLEKEEKRKRMRLESLKWRK